MAAESPNDVGQLLEPFGSIAGWTAVCFVTVFPLTGLATGLVFRHGWTHNELPYLWISSFALLSTAIYLWVSRRRGASKRQLAVRTLILGIILLVGSQFILANLFGAIDRGKQKQAMAEMREIGSAMDEYKIKQGHLPDVERVRDFLDLIGSHLPTRDPWGGDYLIRRTDSTYRIISCGADRKPDPPSEMPARGPQPLFKSDIVFQDGDFLQWPEGIQR